MNIVYTRAMSALIPTPDHCPDLIPLDLLKDINILLMMATDTVRAIRSNGILNSRLCLVTFIWVYTFKFGKYEGR